MHLEYFKKEIIPLKDKLFRYALNYLKESSVAEDVIQDVFLKLWKKREEFYKIKNIESWSMTMTRNLSLDLLKRNKVEFTDPVFIKEPVMRSGTPDNLIEQSELKDNVHEIIESLSEKQRQVVFLRDIEGYSYREISEIIGIDQNLVKVTLFRARENLRKKLLNTDRYEL